MRIIGCSDALLHIQLKHLLLEQHLVKDTPQVSLNLSLSFPSLVFSPGNDPRETLAIAVTSDGTGRKLAQIIKSV